MEKSKKLIITICGHPGSGKSTAAKGAAEKLNFKHFSSGDLFREIAKEHGMDVLEQNKAAEQSHGVSKIDGLVDQRLRDLGKQEDRLVIDSRMAWHWMPASFKVFLDLDMEIAAERIIANMTPERIKFENIPENPSKYAELLAERLASESRRYKNMYNVDPYNKTNYDLIVDTNVMNQEEVVAYIVEKFSEWSKSSTLVI